jgi:hypothetical protein
VDVQLGRGKADSVSDTTSQLAVPRPMGPIATRDIPTTRWGRTVVILILFAGLASMRAGILAGMRFLVLLGFLLAVAGLRRPVLGMLGVGILCTLDSFARVYFFRGGFWRWNTFNYWLLIFLLLHLRTLLSQRDVHTRLALALWIVMALGLLVSPDIPNGLYSLLNFTSLFGLQVYCLRGARRDHALYWVAVVSGVLGVVTSVLFYTQAARLPYMNKNAWASTPLTPVLLASFVLLRGTTDRRGAAVLSCLSGCNLVLVFLSASRGAFAVACGALLITLSSVRGLKGRLKLLLLCLLVCVPFLSLFPNLKDYATRNIQKVWDPHRSLSSRTSGRWDLAVHGIYLARKYPLGVGTGGYAVTRANVLPEYDPDDPSPIWTGSDFMAGRPMQAHSGWIKVLVENGVVGFGLLLAYTLSFAFVGLRHRRQGALPLGILGTLIPTIGLLPSEFAGKWLWLTLAVVTAEMDRRLNSKPLGQPIPSECVTLR